MPKKDDIMVSTQTLEKTYEVGNGTLAVLRDINLQIPKAKFVVLYGPSGSGKTTFSILSVESTGRPKEKSSLPDRT